MEADCYLKPLLRVICVLVTARIIKGEEKGGKTFCLGDVLDMGQDQIKETGHTGKFSTLLDRLFSGPEQSETI